MEMRRSLPKNGFHSVVPHSTGKRSEIEIFPEREICQSVTVIVDVKNQFMISNPREEINSQNKIVFFLVKWIVITFVTNPLSNRQSRVI